MSYARPGEGSDVYVYATGPILHCHYGNQLYETESHQEMHDHLMLHRSRGHAVPERALERLWCEARGLPFESDVEASLRALRETEQWAKEQAINSALARPEGT